ncbi:CCA tRNA nucleotidyltransferase [Candidatus Sumerlaeota bacterium]|nr:CCA tRNA nucleotidyltransferase [Candidatus Sumerlaeota bacterium]
MRIEWDEHSPVVRSARRIVERLAQADHAALWVGGCVRDALLGLAPGDIDVATDAPPEVVQSLFPRHVAVGAQFGVILVIDDDVETEVATFRSEGEYLDARHPSRVRFSTPEEDARRRDFTINALFYDPRRECLLDHVGGRADLEARILRAIGEPRERFAEDALRLLRAVRFAVRFELEIEPRTFEALREAAPRILKVSAERIRDELGRIFTGPRRGEALRLLDRTGLLDPVLPEVAALRGIPQPEEFHPEGDVFMHTVLALDHLPANPSATLAFATLLHDVGKPETIVHADRIRFDEHNVVGAEAARRVCRRLKFSNADRKQIVELVDRHMDFMNVQKMRPARLRRFLGMEGFDEHLELHRADCLASHGNTENYEFCKEKIAEFSREDSEGVLPAPLLTGHDLIRAGYPPGPRMGKILAAVREAQLEGEIASADEALRWALERYPLTETPGTEDSSATGFRTK